MNEDQKREIKLMNRIGLVVALVAILSAVFGIIMAYGNGNTAAVTGTLTVNTFCAFTTNVAGVTFSSGVAQYAGTFVPPDNTIGTSNTVNVINTGVTNSNILVSGTDCSWVTGSVSNTIWATKTHSYFVIPANVYTLTNALQGNEIQLSTSTSDTGEVVSNTLNSNGNTLYLGVGVPSGIAPATYTQTIDVLSSC